MNALTLSILPGVYSIHQVNPEEPLPTKIFKASFLSITKTDEEVSLVLPKETPFISKKADSNWSCLKVKGPLDFGLTGLLASLSTTLANAGISIFAISTYNTDYILVKKTNLEKAIRVLEDKGHEIIR
ncbi:ACT domain-containing protein [bacterium]|nr:ACT domain-containing protein [bacterium]